MSDEIQQDRPISENQQVRFSEQRNELFAAMAKARKGFKAVIKRSINPFFKSKYADLAEILDATTNSLSDCGLSVMQFPIQDDAGHIVIVTVLGHSSGQWVEARLPMPLVKMDAQAVGSVITYGRRYSIGALLNVASENDDDANAAVDKAVDADWLTDQLQKIAASRTADELKSAYMSAYKVAAETPDKAAMDVIIKAKDAKKRELPVPEATAPQVEPPATQTRKPLFEEEKAPKTQKGGITDKQIGRLFAIAKSKNVPEGDVRQYVKDNYGFEHLHELNKLQYEHVCTWAGDQQP